MGIIGVSIGLAFLLALILGPPLEAIDGLTGLFGATSIIALVALVLLWVIVPTPVRPRAPAAANLDGVLIMLRDRRLLVLNGAVFFLHMLLTAAFIGLPLLLVDHLHLPVRRHWELYLPVMLIAAFVMGACLHRIKEVGRSLRIVTWCIGAIGLALMGLALFDIGAIGDPQLTVGIAATLFFCSFNLLEAALPSLVSRLAPAALRGAAMGAYSTSQFLGAFVGGTIGGLVLSVFGLAGLFFGGAAMTLLWLPLVVLGARRIERGSTVAAVARAWAPVASDRPASRLGRQSSSGFWMGSPEWTGAVCLMGRAGARRSAAASGAGRAVVLGDQQRGHTAGRREARPVMPAFSPQQACELLNG